MPTKLTPGPMDLCILVGERLGLSCHTATVQAAADSHRARSSEAGLGGPTPPWQ